MRLSKALKEKLMDVRLRDKLIAEGKITQKMVDEYFKSLQDESSNLKYSTKTSSKEEEAGRN